MADYRNDDAVLGEAASRSKVRDFVWTVHQDVDAIVEMREVLFLVAPQRTDPETIGIVRNLPEAWVEIRGNRDQLLTAIMGTAAGDGPVFYQVGLAGHQLDVKLELWRQARGELLSGLHSSEDPQQPGPWAKESPAPGTRAEPPLPRVRGVVKSVLKWIARILGYADTILGSLTTVLPIAEPLKEFKETLEKLLGDVSEGMAG